MDLLEDKGSVLANKGFPNIRKTKVVIKGYLLYITDK